MYFDNLMVPCEPCAGVTLANSHSCTVVLVSAAPEVLKDGMSHGAPVDYWSLGCILYVMLFGRYPFLDKEDIQDPSTQYTRSIHRWVGWALCFAQTCLACW